MGGDDAQCGRSNMGGGSGTSSSDPNRGDVLCNGMDATNLASIPNSMVNASKPMKVPRTNRR